MRLGLVTYNVGRNWDIETIIERLEAARYEAVELRSTHAHGVEPSLSKAERVKVRDRFLRSKVRLLSLGTACEYHSPDPAVVRKNIDETRQFVELAHDLGCWGIKVRPNGLPKEAPERVTLQRIGEALRECGDIGGKYGIEIWVEVHGRGTSDPARMRTIMDACGHSNVGICWNCNPGEAVNGSVKPAFELLKPFILNVHLKSLAGSYPNREFFSLLRSIGYERYALAEVAESKEPERFLQYYGALWRELNRA